MDSGYRRTAAEGGGNILLTTMLANGNGGLPVHIVQYNASTMSKERHMHNYIQITYLLNGKCTHNIENDAFSVVKGDVIVVPPLVSHHISGVEDDLVFNVLEFEPDFIEGVDVISGHTDFVLDFDRLNPFLDEGADARAHLCLTGRRQVVAEEIFRDIMEEYTRREKGFLLSIRAGILKLLVLLGRAFQEGEAAYFDQNISDYHREAIYKALDFIEKHYTNDIDIDTVAKNAHLSRSYFTYLFKSVTGRSFVEYINALRISRARKLLTGSNNMVVDVCHRSGFNNVAYFNRVFKKMTGISPRQYRMTKHQAVS